MVFIVVQNLAEIGALISVMFAICILACLALKHLRP